MLTEPGCALSEAGASPGCCCALRQLTSKVALRRVRDGVMFMGEGVKGGKEVGVLAPGPGWVPDGGTFPYIIGAVAGQALS